MIASEILWTFGLPSVDEGHTLQTAAGAISVGEGCSGIRGVQLAIMASLFWAALFWLGPWRGGALLFGGIALAFLLNVIRVVFVAGVAIHAGRLEAGERIHDLVSAIAQVLLVGGIPAMAMLFRPRVIQPGLKEEAAAPIPWTTNSGKAVIIVIVWLLASEAAAEEWFRFREADRNSKKPRWSVRTPLPIAGASEQPLTAQIREAYHFSHGLSAGWHAAGGAPWTLFWLDFDAGEISACTHNVHRPEVCLPSHDCELLREFPDLQVNTGAATLLFHHQLYHRGAQPLHLFFATVEETGGAARTVADWSYAGRLSVAWRGIRGQRSEMIHLLAEAAAPPEEIRKAADAYFRKLLIRTEG
jgi:exosortase/archaeosortase family protein